MSTAADTASSERGRTILRWALGGVLVVAGTGHLTAQREEFQAQVPDWIPIDPDAVVLASGVVEIMLGLALLLVRRQRTAVGLVVAGFFVVIFPGNIAQFVEGTDAFGLDTPPSASCACSSSRCSCCGRCGRPVPPAGSPLGGRPGATQHRPSPRSRTGPPQWWPGHGQRSVGARANGGVRVSCGLHTMAGGRSALRGVKPASADANCYRPRSPHSKR